MVAYPLTIATGPTIIPYPVPSYRMQGQQPARQNEQRQRGGPAVVQRRPARRRRLLLQNIALSTAQAINEKIVDASKTIRRTRYYPPDARELAGWMHPLRYHPFSRRFAKISIAPMSTLQGVQYFYSSSSSPRRIGVLNFASAIHPGGGFLKGSVAQEESIARSSTLYVSLTSDAARPFYALHHQDEKNGFYSHAMIYSPNVHILRDDAGTWLVPHQVDVLTSPAVNAGRVRRVLEHLDPDMVEIRVWKTMYERIARILALFERKGARNLVLGSFGTGVFQNNVKAMATAWEALLLSPSARFGKAFETILFAIPDEGTRKEYERVFQLSRT